MIQYNLISIDGIYLTGDATSTGTKYITEVEGLDQFLTANARNTVVAIDGTPYVQRMPNRGGAVRIKVPVMRNDDFEAVRAALDALDAAGSTVTVTADGPLGDFELTCYLAGIEQSGDYLSNSVRDVTFSFTVAAFTRS